jgi:hypothetical protein
MKKPVKNEELRTWLALNDALRAADEKDCQRLLKEEKAGRGRKQFLKRIHSRLNKVRADRERKQLEN